jgi:hypothetical protein
MVGQYRPVDRWRGVSFGGCSKDRQLLVLGVFWVRADHDNCLNFMQKIRPLARILPVFQELLIKAQKPVAFQKPGY